MDWWGGERGKLGARLIGKPPGCCMKILYGPENLCYKFDSRMKGVSAYAAAAIDIQG